MTHVGPHVGPGSGSGVNYCISKMRGALEKLDTLDDSSDTDKEYFEADEDDFRRRTPHGTLQNRLIAYN